MFSTLFALTCIVDFEYCRVDEVSSLVFTASPIEKAAPKVPRMVGIAAQDDLSSRTAGQVFDSQLTCKRQHQRAEAPRSRPRVHKTYLLRSGSVVTRLDAVVDIVRH